MRNELYAVIHKKIPGRARRRRQQTSEGRNSISPHYFESLVEPELLIRRYNRNLLGQGLSNDLSIKGIAVMEWQPEKFESMLGGIGQDREEPGAFLLGQVPRDRDVHPVPWTDRCAGSRDRHVA